MRECKYSVCPNEVALGDKKELSKNPFKKGELVTWLGHGDGIYVVLRVDGEFITTTANPLLRCHYSEFKRSKEVVSIVTDGLVSTAQLIRNGKKIAKVALRRHSDDKHDLRTLIAFAVNKLLPAGCAELTVRPTGYSGAVAVVKSNTPYLTPGMILEFYGGEMKQGPANFVRRCTRYRSFAEVQRSYAQFGVEFVELHRNYHG